MRIKPYIGIDSTWGSYSIACTVSTPTMAVPAAPSVVGSDLNALIEANPVTGATSYKFQLTDEYSGGVSTYTTTNYSCILYNLTYIYGGRYSITWCSYVNGAWTPFSTPALDITDNGGAGTTAITYSACTANTLCSLSTPLIFTMDQEPGEYGTNSVYDKYYDFYPQNYDIIWAVKDLATGIVDTLSTNKEYTGAVSNKTNAIGSTITLNSQIAGSKIAGYGYNKSYQITARAIYYGYVNNVNGGYTVSKLYSSFSSPVVINTPASASTARLAENENSIEDTDAKIATKVHIYPNPTEGILTIESDAKIINIKVSNSAGIIVLTSDNGNLNMENLNAGMYYIITTTQNGTEQTKVIKQ